MLELIGIINKPLLLHPVGVYIIYVNDTRSDKHQINIRTCNVYMKLYTLHCYMFRQPTIIFRQQHLRHFIYYIKF